MQCNFGEYTTIAQAVSYSKKGKANALPQPAAYKKQLCFLFILQVTS